MNVTAPEKIVASKQLKANGLNGFRIHDAERFGGQLVVQIIVANKWALTATLEKSRLTDLALGWPA